MKLKKGENIVFQPVNLVFYEQSLHVNYIWKFWLTNTLSLLHSATRPPKKTNQREAQNKECYYLNLTFTTQTMPGIQYQCYINKGTSPRIVKIILKFV